jgi:hypothetical protein
MYPSRISKIISSNFKRFFTTAKLKPIKTESIENSIIFRITIQAWKYELPAKFQEPLEESNLRYVWNL